MDGDKDIIGYDFQGWPIRPAKMEDLIKALCDLGVIRNGGYGDNTLIVDKESEAYKSCEIVTLEDDGMGYGVNPMPITEFTAVPSGNRLQMFREKPLENIQMWMEDGVRPGDEITWLGRKGYVISLIEENGAMYYKCRIELGGDLNNVSFPSISREDIRGLRANMKGDGNGDR